MATNVREKSEATIKPKKEKARATGAAQAAARGNGPFDKAVRYLSEVQTELRKTTCDPWDRWQLAHPNSHTCSIAWRSFTADLNCRTRRTRMK